MPASKGVGNAIGEMGPGDTAPKELKRRTAHGALISIGAQVASMVLRVGSMMILARLLLKQDFGLVNMVTAFTGFLWLFRDMGLSMATVQRPSITEAQTSMLFWINLGTGGVLAGLAAAAAPLLVWFYGEPRLFWITVALGGSLVFHGGAAQHRALLQRRMRFLSLSVIDITALVVSIAVGIGMAAAGQGYWALVLLYVTTPVVSFLGAWLTVRWVPGLPRQRSGVRSMLWYGGTLTLNGAICYLAYNIDKVLVGRFLGVEALGVYGRAYQLINLPTENLISTIGAVAFPALSRVQGEPLRLRSYFLKGYRIFLSLILPITMACALFSEDIIRVFLGAKWNDAAPLFRLMSPSILAFALINPLGWLLMATGRAARSLRIAFLIAPVVILAYFIGLRHGADGVAVGFSTAMVLLVVPVIFCSTRNTTIRVTDILEAIAVPFTAILPAVAAVWATSGLVNRVQPTFLRLVSESAVLFGVYLATLLFVFGQRSIYAGLLSEIGLRAFWQRKRS